MSHDGLPGYDDWKTTPPGEDGCEFCGAGDTRGWQPRECTGECRRAWRDPDAEYERDRDDG